MSLIRREDFTYIHLQTSLWATAELAFGLLCSCLVVLPRLYQHFCDITPYKTNPDTTDNDPRTQMASNGRTKREWVQLEAKAAKDQSAFSKEARLPDEEALDAAQADDVK